MVRDNFQIRKCALFQMKNSNKIAEKLVKIREWCSLLVMMFGNVFRVQGPECITKYGNILKNSQKIRKKCLWTAHAAAFPNSGTQYAFINCQEQLMNLRYLILSTED
jgi:hypothetical protein